MPSRKETKRLGIEESIIFEETILIMWEQYNNYDLWISIAAVVISLIALGFTIYNNVQTLKVTKQFNLANLSPDLVFLRKYKEERPFTYSLSIRNEGRGTAYVKSIEIDNFSLDTAKRDKMQIFNISKHPQINTMFKNAHNTVLAAGSTISLVEASFNTMADCSKMTILNHSSFVRIEYEDAMGNKKILMEHM